MTNIGRLWGWIGMRAKNFLYLFLAVWLAFPGLIFILSTSDYYLLIGTRGTTFYIQVVLNCAAAACGIVLAFLHYLGTEKARKNKVILAVITAGAAFLLLCGNLLCIFFDGWEEYHSFTSPDGAHTIVIMENVSLISGQVVLYERVNPFLICPKERIVTDDGYRPVCAGKYSLVWQEDAVTLSVADGAGGSKTISVTLEGH